MEPLFKQIQQIESPISDFTGAGESLLNLVRLQKEAFLLQSKIETHQQIVRIAWGVLAAVSVILALLLTVFWISWSLYQNGVSALRLGLGCFSLFTILTAFFLWKCLGEQQNDQRSNTLERS